MHTNEGCQLMLTLWYAVSSYLGRLMFFSIMETAHGPLISAFSTEK